jgi:hypothetical protein
LSPAAAQLYELFGEVKGRRRRPTAAAVDAEALEARSDNEAAARSDVSTQRLSLYV